jgi:hypothetical protein
VRQFAAALNEPSVTAEAGEIIRGLINRIRADAGQRCVLKALLHRYLAAISDYAEGDPQPNDNAPNSTKPGALLSVVAGARNCLDLLLSASIDTTPMRG